MLKRLLILLALSSSAVAHQYPLSLEPLATDWCNKNPTVANCIDPVIDSDGDGISDDLDECPNDPTNTCNNPVEPPPTPNQYGAVYQDCLNTLNAGSNSCSMAATSTHKSISSVWPSNLSSDIRGQSGPSSILYAWTGAAWDHENGKGYFFGGGHADYNGNEVYEYDYWTNNWTRLTDPSPVDHWYKNSGTGKYCKIVNTDEVPGSVHTYDGIFFNPTTKTIFLSNLGPTQIGCTSTVPTENLLTAALGGTYEFNPSSTETRNNLAPLTWKKHNSKRYTEPRSSIFPTTDGTKFWIGARNTSDLYKLNGNDIEFVKQNYTSPNYGNGVHIAQKANNVSWFASQKNLTRMINSYKVFDAPYDNEGIGLAEDTKNNQMVMWNGINKLYVFDITSETWCTETLSGPKWKNSYQKRVYSKFDYIESEDIFIGLSSHDEPVWLIKRQACLPQPVTLNEEEDLKKKVAMR